MIEKQLNEWMAFISMSLGPKNKSTEGENFSIDVWKRFLKELASNLC